MKQRETDMKKQRKAAAKQVILCGAIPSASAYQHALDRSMEMDTGLLTITEYLIWISWVQQGLRNYLRTTNYSRPQMHRFNNIPS